MAARKLTPRQQRFVQEYLKDLDSFAAAQRAGYKDATKGRQLVTNRNIAEEIRKAMERREARTEITQDWVLKRLKEEAELKGEGASHGARVKALELLGKHLAMFTDRVIVEEGIRLEFVEEIVRVEVVNSPPVGYQDGQGQVATLPPS